LVAAIFVLQLCSSAAAIYLLRTQMLDVVRNDRVRRVLEVRDDLLATYYDGGRAEVEEFVEQRHGSTADPLIFVALTGNGRLLLSHIAEAPNVNSTTTPETVNVVDVKGAEPGQAVAIATDLSDGSRLVVGATVATERGFNLAFAEAITLTVVLTALLALLGALLLGYVISRRTHAIAETAEALAAGNFAARISHEDTGDGFDHLRRQMNLMAERIDTLVRELQSISGALAHDLRSPVARLRASIDTALAAVPDGPPAEALQLARSDAEALQAMLATALELSRLESGMVEDRRQILDLGEVALDMVELYEPLAEQRGIALICQATTMPVRADAELLARALSNLIDNALKYGGDRIVVSTQAEGAWATLTVADNGPGIASEDRARAVDRFMRLDNARTRPGAGLGLAMVSAVAQLHGGRLELSGADESGGVEGGGPGGIGLVARLRLPRG
jgi:signal transduction histidine kinase